MDVKSRLSLAESVIRSGRYKDTWESLAQYEPPKWFRDAKFGVFIHWGVYSVPAFGSEWYSRNMYIQGSQAYEHHILRYGKHSQFGYKDFIPMFSAEKFNPEAWMRLIKQSGAKYVVPVAEHHDGFQMYSSALSRWNAVEMGPKRDVLGELFQAARERGLTACLSSHRLEHWFFMGRGREFDSDVSGSTGRDCLYWPSLPDPDFNDVLGKMEPPREFMEDWLARTCELIDEYRPALIYFDWWIHHKSVKPWLRKAAAYYYNRAEEWGREVVINYKYDAFPFGTAVIDVERGQFAGAQPFCWQSCTSVARNSWCHTQNNSYKSANELICNLCDIVSKNGCMLLNIGPKADGSIPDEDASILRDIGAWLAINGEAIFGSRPWRVSGEGGVKVTGGQFSDCERAGYTASDIRYMVNNGRLYAVALGRPEDGRYRFTALRQAESIDNTNAFSGIIKSVSALGRSGPLAWSRDENSLTVRLESESEGYPVVFKFELE